MPGATTVVGVTTMLTWQAEDGHGLEGTRLLLGSGGGFRALGRMVRTGPDGDYTASYRLVVADDGTVERLSVTSATAQRERHLTLNRTEDGFWLLDTGSGGTRAPFGGAVDVDLAHSPMFNTVPIRRLRPAYRGGRAHPADGVRDAARARGAGGGADLRAPSPSSTTPAPPASPSAGTTSRRSSRSTPTAWCSATRAWRRASPRWLRGRRPRNPRVGLSLRPCRGGGAGSAFQPDTTAPRRPTARRAASGARPFRLTFTPFGSRLAAQRCGPRGRRTPSR